MGLSKSLKISRLKPIRFKLFSSELRIFTHPHNQIDVIQTLDTKNDFLPFIRNHHDYYELSVKDSKSIFPNLQFVKADVYLPEKSDVELITLMGKIDISGLYSKMKAKLYIGELIWNVQTEGLKEGKVDMLAGQMQILHNPEGKVNFQDKSFYQKIFQINNARFSCKMTLGNIKVEAIDSNNTKTQDFCRIQYQDL